MNEQDLTQLATHIEPDTDFVDGLEAQLRQHHQRVTTPQTRKKQPYWRWASVAILSICIGLMALLPPAQTFAMQIFDFFFRTEGETIEYYPEEHQDFPETVEVESIQDAEALAGFDVYEWTDDRFVLRWIFAAEGITTLIYEQADSRGNVIHINQSTHNVRPLSPFNAVPEDVPIENVMVNDFAAQYVEGYWVNYGDGGNPIFEWTDDYFRQLHWVTDEYDFYLMFNESMVDDAQEAIGIAEALVQQDNTEVVAD